MWSVMEKIVERNILYDFYGELLTEHQRSIYGDAIYGDLSLSELAEEYGITRQGVHDLIKRCDKILASYEDKLHLAYKFELSKKHIRDIRELTVYALGEELTDTDLKDVIKRIGSITESILDEQSD